MHAERHMRALYANEPSAESNSGLWDSHSEDGVTLAPTGSSGGATVTEPSVELGGKPNPGTPPDKRLKNNKGKRPTPNAEGEVEVTAEDQNTAQWRGPLVVEDIETGDHREFSKDSITWVEPPMPLRWQKEGSHGGDHDVTVQVGLITKVWREDNKVMGEGHFDLGGPEDDDAHEAFRRMQAGTVTGVSIDADDISDADVEYVFSQSDEEVEDDNVLFQLFKMPEKVIFHAARIRAATLCDIPAFVEASLKLISPEEALTASVILTAGAVGAHSTATSDGAWDGPANEARLPVPVPLAVARKAFGWVDESQAENGAVPKSAAKFIHHEVNGDGTPGAANLTACSTGIGVLHGGRGGTTVPAGDKRGIYNHLAAHLRAGGQEPPPFDAQDVVVAHAWHDDWRPPASWFADPHLGQVMPIMVTDQGRVYGHAAQWGQCHLGYMNECVMPPFESYHAYYRTGEVVTDDGQHIAVGTITAGIEHAPLQMRAASAKEHYENTDAVVAFVVTGNDEHGIWVAGAIRPDAHASRVQALRGSGQVSPDWRRIGGELRMVGLLAVNVSGYQVPKARSLVASGEIRSLIVSGMVNVRHPEPDEEELNRRAMLLLRQALAARVHPANEGK
jgi:hypothetical protein